MAVKAIIEYSGSMTAKPYEFTAYSEEMIGPFLVKHVGQYVQVISPTGTMWHSYTLQDNKYKRQRSIKLPSTNNTIGILPGKAGRFKINAETLIVRVQ